MKVKSESDEFTERNEDTKFIKTIITDKHRYTLHAILVFVITVIFLIIPIIIFLVTFSIVFLWTFIMINMLLILVLIVTCFCFLFSLQKRIITFSENGIKYQVGKKIIFSMKWLNIKNIELHRYKTIALGGEVHSVTTITNIKFIEESEVNEYRIDLRKIKIKEFLRELIRFADIMNKELIIKKSWEDISRNDALLEEFIK